MLWIFLIPFIIIFFLVMLLVASRYARRDVGRGRYPNEEFPGANEPLPRAPE